MSRKVGNRREPGRTDDSVNCDENEIIDDQVPNEHQALLNPAARHSPFVWRRYLLEIVLFFQVFAFELTSSVETTLFMNRACLLYFNGTNEYCDENNTEVFDKVEEIANNYEYYCYIIRHVPSAVLLLFTGPWSDKFGKKPAVYFALVGQCLYTCGMLWFVTESSAPLYYAVLIYLLGSLTGSSTVVKSNIHALASDRTSERSRIVKFGILNLSSLLGNILGGFTSGILFARYGNKAIYLLATALGGLPVLCFYFVKDEGIRMQSNFKTKLLGLFSCLNIKESIGTVIKKRENKGRAQVLILLFCFLALPSESLDSKGIQYLFCKKMYGWSLTYYTDILTAEKLSSMVFMLIFLLVIIKACKVVDLWIGFVAVLIMVCQDILRAFSYYAWMYLITVALGVTIHIPSLVIRSSLTNIVGKSEYGKIMSPLAIVEAIRPCTTGLITTRTFNASVEFYPGLTFLVEASIILTSLLSYLYLARHPIISLETAENRNEEDVINNDTMAPEHGAINSGNQSNDKCDVLVIL